MKTAFVFPGQGSQFVGMAKSLIEKHPSVLSFFEKANEILGWDILSVMSHGSAEELQQTKVTQNAVFIYSIAAFDLIKDKRSASAAAGHSLGEFSSLAAANTLSFEDALALVNARALAMQKACESEPSSMSVVLGLDNDIVEKICLGISEEIVVAANYNSPGQIAISGTLRGLDIAKEKLVAAGAKRVVSIPVGGAFHSPLMKVAQDELKEYIAKTHFLAPAFPIYQNATAQAVTDVMELKSNLIAQIVEPVKWAQSARQMHEDGIEEFIEIGPGNVLQGLIRKTVPAARVLSWEELC